MERGEKEREARERLKASEELDRAEVEQELAGAAAPAADEAEKKEAFREKARKDWEAIKAEKELAQERGAEAVAAAAVAAAVAEKELAQEREDVAAAVAAVAAAVAAEEAAKEEASLEKAAAEELSKMQESAATASFFFQRLSISLLNKLLLSFSHTLCRDSSVTVGKLTYYPFLRLGSLRQDVFRGKLEDGKFCAIKKQPLSVAQSTRDEVKILRELSHDNIVRLHDYQTNIESCFVALEHCHGTLDDLVVPSEAVARSATSARLPRPLADEGKLRVVISQTLAAIKFLHSKDVAHR